MTNRHHAPPGLLAFSEAEMTMQGTDHWNDHARRWQHFGPPLRPLPIDVAVVENLAEQRPSPFPGTVCRPFCGVTPELAAMQWPERTRLHRS